MDLQERFDGLVRTLTHYQLPLKCLVISDFHAGRGDKYDPLKGSGMESKVIDLLKSYQDYAWMISEAKDIWRGFSQVDIDKAHPELTDLIYGQEKRGKCYQAISNHNLNLITLPDAWIFEGYGLKVYFDHGHLEDWPNDEGWKIGRAAVRMADMLGLDPETSPHPSNPDRHAAVRKMRQKLADDNLDWQFFWGHTHWFENVGNNHNDGSPIGLRLTYYIIEEGKIIAVS